MRIENNSILCAFCGKPGMATHSKWACARCKGEMSQSDIHENLSGFTMSDCCNAPAKPVQWICNICGKVNGMALEAPAERIKKEPFNGSSYVSYEDSLNKVRAGHDFLKSLKKRA